MIDEIRAVAADIDNTLAMKYGALPEANVEALRILKENNILIGLCTGRELKESTLTMGKSWNLGFEFDFVIGMNGGMVYDRFHEGIWSVDLIDNSEMKAIMEYFMPVIQKYKIAVNAEGDNNRYVMYRSAELLKYDAFRGITYIDASGDIDLFCSRKCYKILFRMELEQRDEFRTLFNERFADEYQIVESYPGTLEVMRKGYDKGTGLQLFAERNNIPVETIIAFGDSENDNAVLKAAGWGVCLRDGDPETIKISDDITDYDCKDGGFGRYLIDRYLKPKGLYKGKY